MNDIIVKYHNRSKSVIDIPTIIMLLCVIIEVDITMFRAIGFADIDYLRYFVLLFSSIYLLCYRDTRKIIFSKPICFYFLWCIYTFINCIVQGYNYFGTLWQLFLAVFSSFICMVISIDMFDKNQKLMLKILIISLYLYCFGALSYGVSGSSERLGGEMLNPNAIGIRAALVIIPLIIYYLRFKMSLIMLVLMSLIPFVVIVQTGSRTALLVATIILSYFFLQKSSKQAIISKFTIILALYFLGSYILDNTYLGERLLGSTTQSEGTWLETGTMWDMMGDRGYQYYISGPVIVENPIFGIGLNNFVDKGYHDIIFHSEYLIQLCECGIVGFILYFFIYFWSIKNLFGLLKGQIISRNVFLICLLMVIAILFACWVTRVSYYAMYSCCLAYIVYTILNYKTKLR